MATPTLIPSYSTIEINGTDIIINTYYDDGTVSILIIWEDLTGTLNGIPFNQGDVIIIANQIFYVDNIGNLIVVSDDANSFSIDTNGDLIYTY